MKNIFWGFILFIFSVGMASSSEPVVSYAPDLDIEINSFEDYSIYEKAFFNLSKEKKCDKSDALNLSDDVKNFNVNDELLISRYNIFNKFDCLALKQIYEVFSSYKLAMLKRYPSPKQNNIKVLSVDKTIGSHRVMVGNIEKLRWVICYGLDEKGIPLAKNHSLVKSKYTAVYLSSRKYHNEIINYECELELDID